MDTIREVLSGVKGFLVDVKKVDDIRALDKTVTNGTSRCWVSLLGPVVGSRCWGILC